MPRRLLLEPHLAVEGLERRSRTAKEARERSWWQLVCRYNVEGPDGMCNRQYTHSHRAALLLSPEQLAELAEVVRRPAPEGDQWVGRTVAAGMSQRLGRPVSVYLSWAYLVRLEGKRCTPRPRHVLADPAEQTAFKRS